jgi:hypothetical protein
MRFLEERSEGVSNAVVAMNPRSHSKYNFKDGTARDKLIRLGN